MRQWHRRPAGRLKERSGNAGVEREDVEVRKGEGASGGKGREGGEERREKQERNVIDFTRARESTTEEKDR